MAEPTCPRCGCNALVKLRTYVYTLTYFGVKRKVTEYSCPGCTLLTEIEEVNKT